MSGYPKINLTLDSCFAIKRWPRPEEWARVIKEEIGGIRYIEMSTDLDIDPQFNSEAYRAEWIGEVKRLEERYGLKVASFFSGYATYRAMGLLNWNADVRDMLRDNYFKKTVDMAKELGAQVGNTLHAFSEELVDDPEKFRAAEAMLSGYLGEMAVYAQKKGVAFSYEQMYTPNQGWWRIDDCERYMRGIYASAGAPVYTTIDTAHMAGQARLVRPSSIMLHKAVSEKDPGNMRFPREMLEMIRRGTTVEALEEKLDRYAYCFCKKEDGDVYSWLERIACYSPLMHLQQTDGTYSSHRPFTAKYNAGGIIEPRKVLEAIKRSYDRPEDPAMPPRAKEIYLAFELFFGVTESAEEILRQVRESVEYWREVIKEDGGTPDEWL